ncbi:MAG: hypothetical protein ACE5FT_07225 [Candidatus Nanoarchaeia archaeon]
MHEDYDVNMAEENVYSEDKREEFLEAGGISAEEEAFMKGYDEADQEEEEEKDSEEE